jgi:hypothetical protein
MEQGALLDPAATAGLSGSFTAVPCGTGFPAAPAARCPGLVRLGDRLAGKDLE